MRPEVHKEFADLLTMADAWVADAVEAGKEYIGVDIKGNEIHVPGRPSASCDGTEQFLLDDFIEKISQWIMPYVNNISRTEENEVEEKDYNDFCAQLAERVERMRRKLRLPEPNKKVIPLTK